MQLQALFDQLLDTYGAQRWWPVVTTSVGSMPFEMMVGAILTQNTAWRNVERALAALNGAGMLNAERLLQADELALQQWIRPAGYFRQKATRLLRLAQFYCDFEDIDAMRRVPHHAMRAKLLAINGVGAETADSMLLYALQQPAFVIDSYTRRLLSRLGWVDASVGYDTVQAMFYRDLPSEVALFQEYHALIVVHAKQYCRKKPACVHCPVRASLACSYLERS